MLARGLGSWRAGKRKACAGGGVRDSSFGRPSAGCPAEGSSRQESSCLISLDLANAVAACAVVVDHRTAQVTLGGEGKAALQKWMCCPGGGFFHP